MKIAVLGAGAMGSLYGGWLSKSGQDVTLIDVNQAHVDAVNQNGLSIQSAEGTETVAVKASQAADVKEIPELIILFTKTIFSKSALDSARHIVGDKTWVLSLQNGLGNDRLISEYIPYERILVGTTDFPSGFIEPGNIFVKGKGTTKMMTASGMEEPFLNQLADVLNKAGLNCVITKDVFVSIWEKVAFNSAMNALTAITRLKLGDLASVSEGTELAYTVAKEVVKTANKKGVKASEDRVLALMAKDFVDHANHMPSMLQDVLATRQTEVDFIDGAVVKEAEELGLEVPATKALYQLVKVIQGNYGRFQS